MCVRHRSSAPAHPFRVCLAVIVALVVCTPGHRARAQNPVGVASDVAGHVADALEAVCDDHGAFHSALRNETITKLNKISSVLKLVGPTLAIVSITVDLLAPDPVQEALDKLQSSVNGLYDAIKTSADDAAALAAAKTAIDGITEDAAEIRGAKTHLQTYKDNLTAYKAGTRHTLQLPTDAVTDFPKDFSGTIQRFAGKLATSCTGDLGPNGMPTNITSSDIELILKADHLSLKRDIEVVQFIEDWLLDAVEVYSDAFAIQLSFNPPSGVTSSHLQALIQTDLKNDAVIKKIYGYVDACTTALDKMTVRYMDPNTILGDAAGVGGFMKTKGYTAAPSNASNGARTIANGLADQYPYFDWFAIKYAPVVGYENHEFNWWGPGPTGLLGVLREGPQDYNLVVGALTQGEQYQSVASWKVNCGWYLDGLRQGQRLTWILPNPQGGLITNLIPSPRSLNIDTAFPLIFSRCSSSSDIMKSVRAYWVGRIPQSGFDFAMAGKRVDATTKAESVTTDIPGVAVMSGGQQFRHVAIMNYQ